MGTFNINTATEWLKIYSKPMFTSYAKKKKKKLTAGLTWNHFSIIFLPQEMTSQSTDDVSFKHVNRLLFGSPHLLQSALLVPKITKHLQQRAEKRQKEKERERKRKREKTTREKKRESFKQTLRKKSLWLREPWSRCVGQKQ